MVVLLEYVWIDGYNNLRSKIKIINLDTITLNNIPEWNFDGSSTGQATGSNSDIILKPIKLFKNPFHLNIISFLVLCETYNKDYSPHETNNRKICLDMFEKTKTYDFWFGIEQEYIIIDNVGNPYLWKNTPIKSKLKHSDSYCSVGGDRCLGRKISEEHLMKCIYAGIHICGTNAEVMTSQWEYQIGAIDAISVSDELWMSRYIMLKITESYECYVTFLPKPFENQPGSGLHTNVSTNEMREENGFEKIIDACEKLKNTHEKHLTYYGQDNHKRLTGQNETCSYKEFKYAISDRNCSIRIPLNVVNDKKGYFEDRRPGANADPYLVTFILMESITS